MQVTTAGAEKTGTLLVSVGRAINVLDCIGAASRPMSAKSIARATALSLGTTYNILRTLAHSNYVAAERDGYVLGPAHPAVAVDSQAVALARSRTIMNGIRDELGAATYLSRFCDGEIELVDIVDTRLTPRVDLWVGLQDGAHATAFGKQILAALDSATRQDYINRHPLAELTPYTVRSPREFLRELELSPTVAVDDQEYALGFNCLAVPVATSSWLGALAVSFPSGAGPSGGEHGRGLGARREQCAKVLQGAAAQLAVVLGVNANATPAPVKGEHFTG